MFVRNLPPVPEGFDPDTIQFGFPPQGKTTPIYIYLIGTGIKAVNLA